jgi:CheY-like chemotaxis protein
VVRTALAADLWLTRCDGPQLESALLNLSINARDAMPRGGCLVVETANGVFDAADAGARDMASGEYVTISVTDTGVGMPPDVVARAFDPFFTTKPIGQGTGLGLSMVYGFAKQSGGQVRIHSAEGVGTTIWLHLPRDTQGVTSEPASAPSEPVARQSGGGTILVVEDEPFVAMLITDVLTELGYTTIDAHNAAEGLVALRSDREIDLMITDVGLPGGMNGKQLADEGRGVRPGLKVLFVTGYAAHGVLDGAPLPAGMHVLSKPFAEPALIAKVESMLKE